MELEVELFRWLVGRCLEVSQEPVVCCKMCL